MVDNSNELPKQLSSFVWHYLKNKKMYLLGFFIVSMVWAIEMSLSPYLLGKIINIIANDNTKDSIIEMVTMPAVLYVSMSIILNINFRFFNYISLRLYPSIKAQVIEDMYSYLIRHSDNFFQNNYSGTLTKKIQDMATNIEQLIQIPNEWFYPRVLALIIACLMLFITVTPIFSFILLLWGISFVGISYLASKKSETYAKQLSNAEVQMGGFLQDSISNVVSTKLFSNMEHETNRNKEFIQNAKSCDQKLQFRNLKIFFIQGMGVTALTGCMMLALIHQYRNGLVSAGDFALVLTLSISFIMGVFNMGQEILKFSKVIGTCKQSLSFIVIPHEIIDIPNALEIKIEKGLIEFKDVYFSYLPSNPLFEKINLTINPGEKIGLVGYSGGGKTTFVKLLLRLIQSNNGSILIDHQNISNIQKDSLRKSIAVIPQTTDLFHRSIMENIRFGCVKATDEEVINASKKAKCHDFIMSLPDKYNSLVGEKGVKLSGGQKQRISIARAFLKNSPILILDEATSSLDSITEKEIQQSLHEVMQGRTSIVIAHRLSTLNDMDKIAVFDQGKIVEHDTPSALLNNENSVFRKLWNMQSNGFLINIGKDRNV